MVPDSPNVVAVGGVVTVEYGVIIVEEVDRCPTEANVAGVLRRLALCIVPRADTVLGERRGDEQCEGEEQGEEQDEHGRGRDS